MVNGFKFKTFNNFSLDIAMQGFYVGIFLGGSHVGELLGNAFILLELPYHISNKLRSIIVAYGYAFNLVFQ